jgi:hypothetical protein
VVNTAPVWVPPPHDTIKVNVDATVGKTTLRGVIRLKRIYNFCWSMLVYTPFALCFVTLRGIFMHFLELTY